MVIYEKECKNCKHESNEILTGACKYCEDPDFNNPSKWEPIENKYEAMKKALLDCFDMEVLETSLNDDFAEMLTEINLGDWTQEDIMKATNKLVTKFTNGDKLNN